MAGSLITSTVEIWIGEQGVLSLEELAIACGTQAEWIVELVDLGVLSPQGRDRSSWRFGATDLGRARRLLRLCHDFEANLGAAAVILDLLEETERLRARLRRAGLEVD
jgi:chaperone modulatory protein CbpM